jgi:hypothetical protein
MFVASYRNTEAGARVAVNPKPPKPRSIVTTALSRAVALLEGEKSVKSSFLQDRDYQERKAAHRVLRERCAPEWIEALVMDVAEEHGVSPFDLMRNCQRIDVVRVRNRVLYEIRKLKPRMSYPRIGVIFGKDHTSIIHAIAKHAADNNLPALTRYDLDAVIDRNRRASQRVRAATQERG